MTAGSPRRASRAPAGSSGRSPTMTRTKASAAATRVSPLPEPEELERQHRDGRQEGPPQLAARRRGRRLRRGQRAERGGDEDGGQRHQRDHAEEDPAPAHRVGDEGGHGRAEERRQHPRGRERGEDRRAQGGRVDQPDHDVDRDHHRAAAQALEHPADDEDLHRRRGAAHHEPEGEHRHRREQRAQRAAAVGPHPRRHHADDTAREGCGEGEGVVVEAVEVAGDRRHHGRHGHRLEGGEGDEREEPDRRHGVRGGEDPLARLGGAAGHPVDGRSSRAPEVNRNREYPSASGRWADSDCPLRARPRARPQRPDDRRRHRRLTRPRAGRRRAGLPPLLGGRAPQHAGRRGDQPAGPDRDARLGDLAHQGRLGRRDAAQPRTAGGGRAVRPAGGGLPGSHRPRHRPRARHRPADQVRPARRQRRVGRRGRHEVPGVRRGHPHADVDRRRRAADRAASPAVARDPGRDVGRRDVAARVVGLLRPARRGEGPALRLRAPLLRARAPAPRSTSTARRTGRRPSTPSRAPSSPSTPSSPRPRRRPAAARCPTCSR